MEAYTHLQHVMQVSGFISSPAGKNGKKSCLGGAGVHILARFILNRWEVGPLAGADRERERERACWWPAERRVIKPTRRSQPRHLFWYQQHWARGQREEEGSSRASFSVMTTLVISFRDQKVQVEIPQMLC